MTLKELYPVLHTGEICVADSQTRKGHFIKGKEAIKTLVELYGDREVECVMGSDLMKLAISLK